MKLARLLNASAFAIALCASAALAASAQTGTTHTTTQRRHMSTASLLHPASLHATAPHVYHVRFHTTKGYFTVEVTRAWAPIGADRFYNLCLHHFYDGASLFRVVPGFVVQFGLSASPNISKAWANANIKDDPVSQSNDRGYITFATAGPNTRTTQVFINLVNNGRLDGMGFAAFGKVTEGMDVVDKFYGGYGDHGPDQDRLTREGKPYVEKDFPKLDSIITAHIVVPAAHPATHTTPHTPPHPASH